MNTRFQKQYDHIQQLLLLSIKELPSMKDVQSVLNALSEPSLAPEERLDLLCLSSPIEKPPFSFANLVAGYQDKELSATFNFILLDINDKKMSAEDIFNRVLAPTSLVGKPYSFVLLATKPENEKELALDYLFMLKELAGSSEVALAHLTLPYEYMPGSSWNLYNAILTSQTTELIYGLIDLGVLGALQCKLLKHKKDDMFDLIQDASRHFEGDRLHKVKDELTAIIEDKNNPFHQFFSTKRGLSGNSTFHKLRLLLDEVKLRLEGFSKISVAPSLWDSVASRIGRFFQQVPQAPSVNFSEDEDKGKRNRPAFHDDL
ncbi:MAG: hypothetical protein WAW86_01405 [Gammaproteobacteria bacterium]